MSPAEQKLQLAEKHLHRVQLAWSEPDWADLAIYGFYCLEAAVEAAAIAVSLPMKKAHWDKANASAELHRQHSLPDVEGLMRDLNDARKAEAYGDVVPPSLDPEDVATEIEQYVRAVGNLLQQLDGEEGN